MTLARSLQLSPETALIAACCRWPRSAQGNAAVVQAAAAGLDWPRFLRMAQKHRVEALVHDGLEAAGVELPPRVRTPLRERSLQIAARSLLQASTAASLSADLRAAGITAVFLKGSSVEMLAHGRLGLKEALDIDLIVPREQFAAASEVLEANGWKRRLPPADVGAQVLDAYLDRWKDAAFVHEARSFPLELHHRLEWNRALDGIGAGSPQQEVEILSGKTLPTLRDEELFIYLAFHGAVHRWGRLKWLADLSAMLARSTPANLAGLHCAATARGAGSFSAQALLLGHRLLGLGLPPALVAELEADSSVRRRCHDALRAIDDEHVPAGIKGHITTVVIDMQLRATWAERLKALPRYLVSPNDIVSLRLPPRAFFLYYVLRVPLYLGRVCSELVGHLNRTRVQR